MIPTSFSRSRVNSFVSRPEAEHVLAAVLRGAAERLNRERRHRHPDVADALVLRIRSDVVGIVEAHAAIAQRGKVVVVAVLVEGDQHIRLVAGGEHLARTDVDLEDRSAARDRRRDRHVGHHLLGAASGEAGEEPADRLDPVLRITGQPDHGVLDILRLFGRRLGVRACGSAHRKIRDDTMNQKKIDGK